jgi:hypothetical protein
VADVLREFLVSLGFKIDEAGWKKFTGAVAHAGAITADIGATVVEAATAIEVAVSRVARQYETLYYVSARTGQSAQYIQSAGFAFRQIGLSADDATSAIEGVAAAMRLNPGIAALFRGASKPEDIVKQIKGSGLPYSVAARLGEQAGIAEKTFQHLWMFGQQEEQQAADHARRLSEAGINADDASLRFTQFGRVLNILEDDFEILGTRIALDWVGPTEKGVHVLDQAVQWFGRADKATQGWIGTLASLAVTLTGLFGAEKILSKLLGFGGVTLSGTVAKALFGKGRLLKGGLIGGGVALLESMKEDNANPDHPLRTSLRKLFGIEDVPDDSSPGAPAPYTGGGTSGGGKQTRGDRNNNPGNIEYGKFALAHGAVGTDGRFAIFPDKATGVAAMKALLKNNYQGKNLTQIERDWVGYAEPSYLESMMSATGLPAGGVPNLNDPAMLSQLVGGMSRGEGTHITVNTNIHVNGSDDPERVANRVFEKQARVHDNLVRNLLGPHR